MAAFASETGRTAGEEVGAQRHGRLALGPGLVVEVIATEQPGLRNGLRLVRVEVRDSAGGPKQRLTYRSGYPLDQPEGNLCFRDYDFDGFKDLVVLKELAGKYRLYSVFRFRPRTGRFDRDAFGAALGKLPNLRVDSVNKRLITSTIGPSLPYQRVYSVRGGRLLLEASCSFENDALNYYTGTVVAFRRGQGRSRQPYEARDMSNLPCRDDAGVPEADTCLE